jgi:hypothetical protein
MEKYIEKVVKYILDKQFPGFKDVKVTSERDMRSHYIDSKKNLRYNVWLYIDFEPYIMNYIEVWQDIKFLIFDTLKKLGISNEIQVYLEFLDKE